MVLTTKDYKEIVIICTILVLGMTLVDWSPSILSLFGVHFTDEWLVEYCSVCSIQTGIQGLRAKYYMMITFIGTIIFIASMVPQKPER